MASNESWTRAQDAILAYYADETGFEVGNNAYIGDVLPDYATNVMVFIISGGPVQDQNWQCSKGGHAYLANAEMNAQFATMQEAIDFAGKVMAQTPPLENTNSTGVNQRGLAPNVDLCENTTHPELFSREVDVDTDEEEEIVTWWTARIPFRVVYNNNVE